jgi:hypothetical protein
MFSLSHNTKVDGLTVGKDAENELIQIPSGCFGGVAESGSGVAESGSGMCPSGGFLITCAAALQNVKKYILPAIYEKVKDIGDTHYGKSWYSPVPYAQTIQDLEGNNIVGNFKRSWELADSAYTEPSLYYERKIPQSNQFISDGKVSPFVNYDHNFIIEGDSGVYDVEYADDIIGLVGQPTKVFNFSEYNVNELCLTKYGNENVIHGGVSNIAESYVHLPLMYDVTYNRALLPFSDIIGGRKKKFVDVRQSGVAPSGEGQTQPSGTNAPASGINLRDTINFNLLYSGIFGDILQSAANYIFNPSYESVLSKVIVNGSIWLGGKALKAYCDTPSGFPSGFFDYGIINGMPAYTHPDWLNNVVPALQSFNYQDNGRFSTPFVKFETPRVFLPVLAPGKKGNQLSTPSATDEGYRFFTGSRRRANNGESDPPDKDGNICPTGSSGPYRQFMITEDQLVRVLEPFQACVAPKSFNFPQISNRYVYGPWMTNLSTISFRGRIEYEQDESLVPENFLIPTNFGEFGSYTLDQTSGLAGMNLAAQGKANAIDNFGLFAIEEGSITIPGAPAIKRIGDSIYGVQHVSDIRINIGTESLETTYSFKTISPKFGKNTRDLEKKLTKISNDIKKLKLR